MTLPVNPDITVQPAWDYARAAYTLTIDWTALYPDFDENVSFRVQVNKGEEVIGDTSTLNNHQAIYGAPHESELLVSLVVFNGMDEVRYYQTSVTTDIGLPGQLVVYHVDQGEDYLAVSWESIPFADAYRSKIYLGEELLDTRDTPVPLVRYEGLPHSRQFRIEVQPYNSLNDGAVTEIETHTVYLVPPAPYNVRQEGERIIAVLLQWEIEAPEIIEEVQIEAFDGNTMFLQSTMNAWQRERAIPCPSTGSTYLFRLRAGNPAGWSEWVEYEGTTEVFPLIDSRLAALPASYQEDYLRYDTWNHSLRADMGLTEATRMDADFVIAPTGYAYADAGLAPIRYDHSEILPFDQSHSVSSRTWWVQHKIWVDDIALFDQWHSIEAYLEYVQPHIPEYVYGWATDTARVNQTHKLVVVSRKVQHKIYFSDTVRFEQQPSLTIRLESTHAN